MSVGINTNLIHSLQYSSSTTNTAVGSYSRTGTPGSSDASSNNLTARTLEQQQKQTQRPTSVVDQALAYAGTLKEARVKSKADTVAKKKLQYSYKKISSQIVRSKTSSSAKRAAAAARREVQRLKKLKNTGEYDEEELEISIEHAKSMERVAKKKAAHLAQEEMIERNHNGALGGLEEKEAPEERKEENTRNELSEDREMAEKNETENFAQEQDVLSKEVTDDMILHMEEMTKEQEIALRKSSEKLNSEMMGVLQEEMEDMLDLTELEATMEAPNPNMSEEDLKMFKTKHRTKEMKEISEADGAYLKAMFKKYEKEGAGVPAPMAVNPNPGSTGQSSGFEVFI